jgi:hypothetical protein
MVNSRLPGAYFSTTSSTYCVSSSSSRRVWQSIWLLPWLPGRAYTGRMVDKTYLVCLKPPSLALQHVDASRFEIHGEHLVFVDSEGKLAALFLMELVQSWNVLSD